MIQIHVYILNINSIIYKTSSFILQSTFLPIILLFYM